MKTQGKGEYACYDADGNEYRYNAMIDRHQACNIAGYTMDPPGTEARPTANPMRNYKGMSAEDLRKQCAIRDIKAYPLLNREQQVEALQDRDLQEAAAIASNAKAAAKVEAQTDEKPDARAERNKRDRERRAEKKAAEAVKPSARTLDEAEPATAGGQ